jgi:hypothetical protein
LCSAITKRKFYLFRKGEPVNNLLGDHKRKRQSTSGIICLTRLVAIAKLKDLVNKQSRKVRWKSSGFVGSPRKSAIQDVRHLVNIKIDSAKNNFENFFEISNFQIPVIVTCKYTHTHTHTHTHKQTNKKYRISCDFFYLEEDVSAPKIVFSEEATLYLPGYLYRHYVKFGGI